MIEMTFIADNVEDLLHQVRQFAGQMSHDRIRDYTAPPEGVDIDLPREVVAPKKPAGRPPKAAPEPKPEPVEEMFAEEEAKPDAKTLLKVKDDTIRVLQEAFANGKVVKLRKLLDTYGEGAKSFPEIAPEKFGKIAAAIEKGALNDA